MKKKLNFLSIGFNNYISVEKIIAITGTNTNPIKKNIRQAKSENRLIDCTMGKKVKSAIFMENGTIVLSAIAPLTLYQRLE